MKLIIAIIINDHILTSDPYFWEIFSALPANFYTGFNFSCHIFNFKELFSFSFVQFYDILIYFMVFLLSLGILMIVLHLFLKLCFPCRVSFIQATFFVCLHVCLSVPYTLEAFLRYLAILGFLFIFRYEKMKRWSEALIPWVRSTDNKRHCSVIAWALYWGIPDSFIFRSFFLAWSDCPEKTLLIFVIKA